MFCIGEHKYCVLFLGWSVALIILSSQSNKVSRSQIYTTEVVKVNGRVEKWKRRRDGDIELRVLEKLQYFYETEKLPCHHTKFKFYFPKVKSWEYIIFLFPPIYAHLPQWKMIKQATLKRANPICCSFIKFLWNNYIQVVSYGQKQKIDTEIHFFHVRKWKVWLLVKYDLNALGLPLPCPGSSLFYNAVQVGEYQHTNE